MKPKRQSIIFVIFIIVGFVFALLCFARPSYAQDTKQSETIPIITESVSTIKDTEYVCHHLNTVEQFNDATCIKEGKKETICKECREILKTENILAKGHSWQDIIIREASCIKEGKKKRVCKICNFEAEAETINKKEHELIEENIKPATCAGTGILQYKCSICGLVVDNIEISKLSHDFTIVSETEATPYADGVVSYQCCYCGEKKEEIKEKIYVKGLYIPSVGINADIYFGDCNQYNTDTYDITCDSKIYRSNHHLIFGHNHRTLGKIYNIKVGDLIYFKENGELKTFRVVLSDIGIDVNGHTNIQSVSTGRMCLYGGETETIHMFTCYNDYRYGNCRWIVLAEKI